MYQKFKINGYMLTKKHTFIFIKTFNPFVSASTIDICYYAISIPKKFNSNYYAKTLFFYTFRLFI